MGREDEGVSSTRPASGTGSPCRMLGRPRRRRMSVCYTLPTAKQSYKLSTDGSVRSETQPLQITRRARPQEDNHNKITKESSSGSSDIANQSQSPQAGPSQRRSRHPGRDGTPQRTKGGRMEQPNRQDNLPMEGRTTHKINHMD